MEWNKLQPLIKLYTVDYSHERNLSPNTIRNKSDMMRRFTTFLAGRDFTLEHVKLYLSDMRDRGVSPNSIRTELKNIKAFCKWLVSEGHMDLDFSVRIPVPKVPPRAEQLVSAELAEKIIIAGTQSARHKLHDRQRQDMRLAMRLALRTGLRSCELLALKGSDLHLYDDEPRMLIHSKGGSLDWQPIPIDMVEELKQKTTSTRVFATCSDRMNDALRRGSKTLNAPAIHLHQLRKIYGSTLARNGLPITKVSQLMRHKDISTTVKFYIKYGIGELSSDQNNFHSLTREALPTENVMDLVTHTVEKLGITKNQNLAYEINRRTGELIIRIRQV